jgi:hypothetical protein
MKYSWPKTHKILWISSPHPDPPPPRMKLINNVPVVRNDFKINDYKGPWKRWSLKIETFLGPEMATREPEPSGPKKVEIFRAHPFQ